MDVGYPAEVSIGGNSFAINHEIRKTVYWRHKRGLRISIKKASLE
jgi:hypothetical protein